VGGRVSLALVIHNHQPVGNFGWVIADVYEHAYSPMLDALERHPGIRLGLHYTAAAAVDGANRPRRSGRSATSSSAVRWRSWAAATTNRILVTLPDRDRNGQLVRMRDEMEIMFRATAGRGMAAERVWEPSLAYDLAAAGYEWTVLDDNHLRAASIREDEMWAPLTTDDRGRRLTVFGTEQGLR